MICNFLLALTFATAGAGNDDPAILQQLIITYFDGVANKDFVRLASLTTGDFQVYEDGQVWNNDSVFRNIQYHQPFTVKFTLTDFKMFADSRSGYGSYHSHADFVVADSVKFALDFIETATFRKTAAGWKINLIHLTELKPPAVYMPAFYRKYDTVRYVPEHYQQRMELFRSEAMRKGGVIFLGNSIIEFGDWRQLLHDSGVVNRGIAGDNTFGILDRLQEVIARRPEKLYIEAGINDIGQGVPVGMITGNIASIVGQVRVKSPGTRIYVVSVLPTNDNARADYPEVYGKNAVVQEVDRQLRQQAGAGGFTYIDLAARVMDQSGNLDKKYARPDGLHLNKEGYAVLAGLLADLPRRLVLIHK
jgi:lysophospholipase L1-like esterase/ketosteroid isomerase-like protein